MNCRSQIYCFCLYFPELSRPPDPLVVFHEEIENQENNIGIFTSKDMEKEMGLDSLCL